MAFSCFSRLGNKQVLSALGKFPAALTKVNYAQSATGVPKISFKPFEQPKVEHYDDKNERMKRPLSPHLTIYSLQLTSTLSITHRIAGMILTGYMTAFGIGAMVLPHDVTHYITMLEGIHLSPATIFLAKALIASPLGYHLANGLRHLYWDTAKGLSIKEVYATGYSMLAAATVITLALAAL